MIMLNQKLLRELEHDHSLKSETLTEESKSITDFPNFMPEASAKSKDEVVFLVPSRTHSSERIRLATRSLNSLKQNMGANVKLIVVHDENRSARLFPSPLKQWIPGIKHDQAGRMLYESSNATVIRREGRGSASAMLIAVQTAINQGFKYGYIHLDDHIYNHHLPSLIACSLQEFTRSPCLAWLRFSGYPIISAGGREFQRIGDRIIFDEVVLEAKKKDHYTLWSAQIAERIAHGRYWPIGMWHSIFNLNFLMRVLKEAINVANCAHLANVEEHFKSKTGARWLATTFGNMEFGYINMQFSGFEMHRNPHYQLLLAGQNDAEL